MIKKRHLHENDAYHLNFGVPLVLGLVLFLINIEFFAIRFLEKMNEIVTIYMYITFIVLGLVFLTSKRDKKGVRKVMVSFYDLTVHNSAMVLIFLLINYSFSEPIFNKTLEYNLNYDYALNNADIPPNYLKIFEPDFEEVRIYYNKGYHIEVQVDKSIFGYQFIKTRRFVENHLIEN